MIATLTTLLAGATATSCVVSPIGGPGLSYLPPYHGEGLWFAMLLAAWGLWVLGLWLDERRRK